MNLSPEEQFIQVFTRPNLDISEISSLLAYPLNWALIQEKADFHGVAPLIYHHLKRLQNSLTNPGNALNDQNALNGSNAGNLSALGFEHSAKWTQLHNIPSQVFEFFRQAYYGNLARNMALFQELKEILEDLSDRGIKVMILKGAALVETLYENAALRPMSDLDLLIRKKDLAEAERGLLDLGYCPLRIEFSGWWAERFGGERLYIKRADFPIYVDIHWNIATPSGRVGINSRQAEIDRIWNEARPTSVGEVDTYSMPVEDQILHTSVHLAAHHLDFRLIWLKDICELTHQYQGRINWEKIVKNARYLKLGGAIYSCFKCAKEWLEAAIPEEVLSGLRSSYDNSLKTKLHHRLIHMDGDGRGFLEHFYQYLVIPGIGDKGLFLIGAIFPGVPYLRNRYQISRSRMVYLCYLYRPCYILYRASLALFRLMWLLISKKLS